MAVDRRDLFCVFPQPRCRKPEKEMNPVQIMVVAVWVRKGEQTTGIKERHIKEKKEQWHASKLSFSF